MNADKKRIIEKMPWKLQIAAEAVAKASVVMAAGFLMVCTMRTAGAYIEEQRELQRQEYAVPVPDSVIHADDMRERVMRETSEDDAAFIIAVDNFNDYQERMNEEQAREWLSYSEEELMEGLAD